MSNSIVPDNGFTPEIKVLILETKYLQQNVWNDI